MTAPATDLALALDPVRLAMRAGVTPDPWQADLLRSPERRLLMNCSRQSGKSTTAGVLGLHTALYRGPALILFLAPTLRQAGELFRVTRDLFRQLDQAATEVEEESALRLEFANGSRIISLPGAEANVRVYSGVSLLVLDEAARCPDALYAACRPMLATSGGRLVLLSTPFGRRGFFYREWVEGAGWKKVRVTAADCPRISPAFLDQERASVGEWWFRQEYDCEFLDPAGTVFGTEHIHAALDSSVPALFGDQA